MTAAESKPTIATQKLLSVKVEALMGEDKKDLPKVPQIVKGRNRHSIAAVASSVTSLHSTLKKSVGLNESGEVVIGKSRILPAPKKEAKEEGDSMRDSFHTQLSRCNSHSNALDMGPPRRFRHQSFLVGSTSQTPREEKSFRFKKDEEEGSMAKDDKIAQLVEKFKKIKGIPEN